jgi:hypothetical protein
MRWRLSATKGRSADRPSPRTGSVDHPLRRQIALIGDHAHSIGCGHAALYPATAANLLAAQIGMQQCGWIGHPVIGKPPTAPGRQRKIVGNVGITGSDQHAPGPPKRGQITRPQPVRPRVGQTLHVGIFHAGAHNGRVPPGRMLARRSRLLEQQHVFNAQPLKMIGGGSTRQPRPHDDHVPTHAKTRNPRLDSPFERVYRARSGLPTRRRPARDLAAQCCKINGISPCPPSHRQPMPTTMRRGSKR